MLASCSQVLEIMIRNARNCLSTVSHVSRSCLAGVPWPAISSPKGMFSILNFDSIWKVIGCSTIIHVISQPWFFHIFLLSNDIQDGFCEISSSSILIPQLTVF